MDLTKFGVKGNSKDDGDDNNYNNLKPQEVVDKNLDLNLDKIKKDFFSQNIERFLPWFLKYQIKKFQDLILTSEIKKVVSFIEKFKSGKGLLLYGPPGAGKTTTLNLVGNHFDYEIFELNASDTRNKKSISEVLGDVVRQKSLFGKNKLILIDEVDGVSGTYDRGGVSELVKFIQESSYPIVFTANDIESDNIKSLKKKCVLVDFVNNSYELLVGIGNRILTSENISYKKEDLEQFANERNTSDIRGFINDLQANVLGGKFELTDDLEIRDYKRKIEELLDKIYFSYPEDSVKSSFNSDINLDDLFLYLEENTPNVYKNNDMILALNEIGKADVFRGRITKWQYYRFLVYVNFYLTYGVSSSKSTPKKTVYKRNTRILKKWIYGNKVNALRSRTKVEKSKDADELFIERLARFYGCSANRCRKRDLFYFAFCYKNDKEFREDMDKKLGIDESVRKSLMGL